MRCRAGCGAVDCTGNSVGRNMLHCACVQASAEV